MNLSASTRQGQVDRDRIGIEAAAPAGCEMTANPGVLAKTRGRSHRTRVQDLWLASQAIQHSLGLVTRNPGDFADVPGLDVVHVGLHG